MFKGQMPHQLQGNEGLLFAFLSKPLLTFHTVTHIPRSLQLLLVTENLQQTKLQVE